MKKLLTLFISMFAMISCYGQWTSTWMSTFGGIIVSSMAEQNSNIFAAVNGSGYGVYKYDTTTWIEKYHSNSIACVLVDNTNIYAGGGYGLISSNDSGATWGNILIPPSGQGPYIVSLVVTDSFIYAGGGGNTGQCMIYLIDHSGNSIESFSGISSNSWITSLVQKDSNIFAGAEVWGSGGSVYETTLGHNTWTPVDTANLPYNVNALIVFKDTLYAGTDSGIFVYSGSIWKPTIIHKKILSFAADSTMLFAGSDSNIVYQYDTKWTSGLPPITDIVGDALSIYSLIVTNSKIYAGCGVVDVQPKGFAYIFSICNFHPINLLGNNQIFCKGQTTTLNPGAGYNAYLWSTGATTPAISVDSSGMYWVRITDSGGCQAYDTINITVLQSPTKQICSVGFDTVTSKNNVYFPTNLTTNIDSFRVYKEVSLNVWNKIGSAVAGSNHFTDMNCNPAAQSYSYEIAVVDSCGNEGTKSNPHTTITLLANYNSGTQTYGFSWSAYVGLTVVEYYLFGITNSGSETIIDSVPGNQYLYNYVNPNPAYEKYYVGFTAPDCSIMKNVNKVRSNYVHSTIVGIKEIAEINNMVSLYPNPVTEEIQVISNQCSVNSVDIYNMLGEKIYSLPFTDNHSHFTLDIAYLPSNMYIVEVKTEKGVFVKKFVKE